MNASINKFKKFFLKKGVSFAERADFDWSLGVVISIFMIIAILYFGVVEIKHSLEEVSIPENKDKIFSVDTRAMDRALERINSKEKVFKTIPNAPVNEVL